MDARRPITGLILPCKTISTMRPAFYQETLRTSITSGHQRSSHLCFIINNEEIIAHLKLVDANNLTSLHKDIILSRGIIQALL